MKYNRMDRAIFVACDRRMAPNARVLLESLKRNYPDHPPVILQTKGLNAEELKVFDQYNSIHHHRIKLPFTANLPLMNGHSVAMIDPESTYARLAMWTKEYERYDKILYLDADIIVLESLDYIFEFSEPVMIKEPYYSGILLNEGEPDVIKKLKEDDIPLVREMGNAGLLMIPRCHRQQSDLMLLTDLFYRYSGDLKWADQSLLNLWFLKKKIPFLDRFEYNLCAHQWYNYPNCYDFRRTKIIHFTNAYLSEGARLFMMRVGLHLGQMRPIIKSFIRCINYTYKFNRAWNDPISYIQGFSSKYINARKKLNNNGSGGNNG